MPEIDKAAADLFATTPDEAPRVSEEDPFVAARRKAEDLQDRIDKLEEDALPKKPDAPGHWRDILGASLS